MVPFLPLVFDRGETEQAALTPTLLVSLSSASHHETVPALHILDQAMYEKATSNTVGALARKPDTSHKSHRNGSKRCDQSQALQYLETAEASGQFFPRSSGRRYHCISPCPGSENLTLSLASTVAS